MRRLENLPAGTRFKTPPPGAERAGEVLAGGTSCEVPVKLDGGGVERWGPGTELIVTGCTPPESQGKTADTPTVATQPSATASGPPHNLRGRPTPPERGTRKRRPSKPTRRPNPGPDTRPSIGDGESVFG
jgi:hypothetical protein